MRMMVDDAFFALSSRFSCGRRGRSLVHFRASLVLLKFSAAFPKVHDTESDSAHQQDQGEQSLKSGTEEKSWQRAQGRNSSKQKRGERRQDDAAHDQEDEAKP